MSQKRQYKQYPKEFKEEAVALVNEQGYSVPEAAKSLGINANLLYRWKDKIDEVVSPSQMKYAMRELENLRTFKTKAVTIFAVVQFAMGAILFAINFI